MTSGKSVDCRRSVWRKDFSSPGVMKPGTSGPESVLSSQRNVLNERGRLHPKQQRASIRLLFSTDKVFVLCLATPWVCVFPVFPTKKKNEPHLVLQTEKPLQMLQRPSGSVTCPSHHTSVSSGFITSIPVPFLLGSMLGTLWHGIPGTRHD